MKNKTKTDLCNQCFKKMARFWVETNLGRDKVSIWCCDNHKCSNYALLQVPAEVMTKGRNNAKTK